MYALQLKQKSNAAFPIEFCDISEQLLSRLILRATSEKETEEDAETLEVSGFDFFLGSY